MSQFKDKVAVITGGASGIGRAVCEELGRRGAIVTAADVNMPGAEETAANINRAGGKGHAAAVDVTSADDVIKLVHDVVDRHGKIDYMFNNAGIAIFGETRDVGLDSWRQILDINLHGVIYGTVEAYRVMVEQGFGHIVNTSSLAGLIPIGGLVGYVTTKHALVGLSTSLRIEGAELGVKVSVVCPGIVKTPIIDAAQCIGMDMEQLLTLPQPKMTAPDRAAKIILKGVEKNKAVITFPLGPKLIWRLYSLAPGLFQYVSKIQFRKFRALRNVD